MKRIFTLLILSVFCFKAGFSQVAFGAGNLVVLRVGTEGSTTALGSTGTAVYLDEFTPAGTLVRTIAIPNNTSPSPKLVLSGSATSEGTLNLSTLGNVLTFAGYDTVPGVATLTSSTSANVSRSIGVVDGAGNVYITKAPADYSSAGSPRSIISTNGTEFWATTAATTGMRYFTAGSTTSTQLATAPTNLRVAEIYNNQLYVSTGSGTIRVAEVGTGIPTTSGQTITNLPGFPTTGSPYGFFLTDLDASVAGPDVLYVAEEAAAGLQKFSLVGGSWVANGTIAVSGNGLRGLTGRVAAGVVTLYGVNAAGTGSNLISFTDAAGYNVALTGTAVTLATAPTNTAFRGVDFAPQGSLPVTLSSFNASVYNSLVTLNWITATEEHVSHFIVEKSLDAKEFKGIADVPARNISTGASYSYNEELGTGVRYYRLKMMDKDGKFTYSRIVSINGKNSLNLDVYPNPVSDRVVLTRPRAEKGASVEVFTIDGKKVFSLTAEANATQTEFSAAKVQEGTYIVVFTNGSDRITTKFVKL